MRRLTLTLPDDAARMLVRIATVERREPNAQATILLLESLADHDSLDAGSDPRDAKLAGAERGRSRSR